MTNLAASRDITLIIQTPGKDTLSASLAILKSSSYQIPHKKGQKHRALVFSLVLSKTTCWLTKIQSPVIWAAMTLIWRHHDVDFVSIIWLRHWNSPMKSHAILCHFTCQSETVKICTQGLLNLHITKCNTETLELPRFQFCSHWRHRGCPNDNPGATKDNKATTPQI